MTVIDLATPLLVRARGGLTAHDWETYAASHPEVTEAYFGRYGTRKNLPATLNRLGERAPHTIQQVGEVLDHTPHITEQACLLFSTRRQPDVVLFVGCGSSNGFVTEIAGRPTVFICPETFTESTDIAVLLTHEIAHATHELVLGEAVRPYDWDPHWALFYEGFAVHASTVMMPGLPDARYYWFGEPGYDTWHTTCAESRAQIARIARANTPQVYEQLFLFGQVIDGLTRAGYWLGHQLVKQMLTGEDVGGLARTAPAQAAARVRNALGSESAATG